MTEEENGRIGKHAGSHQVNRKEVQGCHCWTAFNKSLIKLFAAFGRQVALRPAYFILTPVVLTLILVTGALRIQILDDPMKLFVPDTSPFLRERRVVDTHFPTDPHQFSHARVTAFEGASRVLVSAKDGRSIFRQALWTQIIDLNYRISNVSMLDQGVEYNYEQICARFDGQCTENVALNINEVVGGIENGSMKLNWPITLFPFVLPQFLGGFDVNETQGTIDDAKAIMLVYFGMIQTPEQLRRTLEWEGYLIEMLRVLEYDDIRISFYASRSLGDELKVKMDSSLPYAPLTGLIMVVSCMSLLWMKDCVRSKPLIGVVGITSAFMASAAAFGFLIYVGAVYTRLNIIAVFLVLGIGVDDIFVAISAWQKTSAHDPVPVRMAKTYGDAAVSVTITSLTNCLSFAIGTTTPIIIVQNFCLYCAVTIIFAYLWFITFCGGFLAIAGYMEERRMHSLFFVKIKPQTKSANDEEPSWLKRMFFSSDLVESDVDPSVQIKPHRISVFFRDRVGDLLLNKYFQVAAVISVIVYLFGAIYGCYHLKQGLYRYRMSRDDSYLNDFHHDDNSFFRKLPYSIQVVITGEVNYSDHDTQLQILDLLKTYENTTYGSSALFTQAWLRGYLRKYKRQPDWQRKVVDETSLIKVLREEHFVNPSDEEVLDLDYNEDFSRIVASRYIIQAANVQDIYDDVRMMELFRKIGQESPFNVTVYHVLFGLFDQHYLLRPLAVQSIVIAAVIVMLVSLLFIPNINGAVAIAFSIISIAAGVLGYMGFWGINLDQVSVGSIFMCIGFSVDFSAHITYTYLSSHETTSEGRLRASLFGLGVPIMQGGITTILSLVTFLMIPGYGYRTFFKTIFLVTIFAVYFSIVLIPLLLSLLEYLGRKCQRVHADPISGLHYKRSPSSFKIAPADALTKTNTLSNGLHKRANGTAPDTNGGLVNEAFSQ